MWFFSRHDKRREPLAMLALAFFAGMVAVIPAALLEKPLRPLLLAPGGLTVASPAALAAIGLIEEGAKLLAAYAVVYRSPHFDEVGDGIVYAVTAAFGFAAIENLFYTAAYGLQVALIRAGVTSLAHAAFAGVSGLYLGLYLLQRGSLGALAAGWAAAAGLHALYDWVVMSRLVSPLFGILLVYGVYRHVVRRLRTAPG